MESVIPRPVYASRDIPIPSLMRDLPRDPRGYPIPVQVFRDDTGRPHFTINGIGERLLLIWERRCGICGKDLKRGYWFVGGPISAFKSRLYMDPPMHEQCVHYALKVCPYMAVPTYSKRIDARTVRDKDRNQIFIDESHIPERPDVFVCVMSKQIELVRQGEYVRPALPYARVEYWRNGQRLADREGKRIADEVVARSMPQVRLLPRFVS